MLNETIKELSERLLDENEIQEINNIISGIKSRNRKNALKKLENVLGVRPKRPIYYLHHEIQFLPNYGTRNIIRYAGDFIDQLVRFIFEDKEILGRWVFQPLGPSIKRLKKHIDSDLYESLILFNTVYARAKHEFDHYEDKSTFEYQDAVYFIFISKRLSELLAPLSTHALWYLDEEKRMLKNNKLAH